MDKFPVVILGAGKIGRGIARMFHCSGHYDVLVADISAEACQSLHEETPVATQTVDVTDESAVVELLTGKRAVISACAFDQNQGIARAAIKAGVSYFDLTEDVATTQAVREISQSVLLRGKSLCLSAVWHPALLVSWLMTSAKGSIVLDRVKMRVRGVATLSNGIC